MAVPSSPTSTVVPLGNLSLLASSTAFLTAAFSSSVNLPLLPTFVFAGTAGSVFSAVVGVFASTKSVPLIVSTDPSGYVIVAVPSFPTSTLVPCGNLSLLASSTAFLTAAFSSSVKLVLSATSNFSGTVGSVFSASVFPASDFCSTKSTPLIVSVDLSGYVIVAVPSSPTVTVVPSGNLSLLASSTAFLTVAFSSSVNLPLLPTFVFAGTAGSVLSAVVFSASVF